MIRTLPILLFFAAGLPLSPVFPAEDGYHDFESVSLRPGKPVRAQGDNISLIRTAGSVRVVSSPRYTVDLGGHVFLSEKFFKSAEMLIKENIIREKDLLEPGIPSREDMLLVHTPEWVEKVVDGKMTKEDIALSGIPFSPEISIAHQLAVQGTIEAGKLALETGLGLHAGGGAHHAFADHGEGFCLLNDIAVAVRKMQREFGVKRIMIVDLDAHQGNGTASIFRNSADVFTFSMHNSSIYPKVKEKSSLDVELKQGTGDDVYLSLLSEKLPALLEQNKPGLVVYLASADAYAGDVLGKLNLTVSGIKARDEIVFRECFTRAIPVTMVLGGGYSSNPDDTVKIHAQTMETGIKLWKLIRAPFAEARE